MGDGRAAAQVPGRATPTRWSRAPSRTALLLEGDPHQLIEGMIIAAYAIEADIAYIFLRWEYRLAREAAAARRSPRRTTAGYLGQRRPRLGLRARAAPAHRSAGRYICGEETALLNALEGKRATPRAKPPFPQVVGLCAASRRSSRTSRRCATCRTSSSNGADWFKALSRMRGRRHQALRRERQGEAARAVGAADGHADARDPRRARRRHARRADACAACCPAAPRPTS